MLKKSFKIFVLFVSLFVVVASVGYSVVALDSKQSVEISNSCCSDQTITNSCCEVKSEGCEPNNISSCCCSEKVQIIQFSFHAPIEKEVKESIFLPFVSVLNIKKPIYIQQNSYKVDCQIFPPPKIGMRLSLLQTYRI
jgi:hypothetical protein